MSRQKATNETHREFIKLKSLIPTQIQVLPAGAETTLFKQFFGDWKDKDETTGPTKAYTMGRIAKVEQVPFDSSTLHSNKAMAAQHGMVDDGKGNVKVRWWFIKKKKKHGKTVWSVRCLNCGLAFRSGELTTVQWRFWNRHPTVTSLAETVTSSSTATDWEAGSNTSSTPGEST